MQQYISDSVIEKKEEAEAIGSTLNEQDLKECVQEIYQTWISQDADVKKRGILSLYGIYSDDKMVGILKSKSMNGCSICEGKLQLMLFGL